MTTNPRTPWIAALALLLGVARPGFTAAPGDAAQAISTPVLERPTLHSLGVYWMVRGDANKNARITLEYSSGEGERGRWRIGAPLFRVERGAHQLERRKSLLDIPADAWLFAGSVVGLSPNTPYKLRLRLEDPDGGSAEQMLEARTRPEPQAPRELRTLHVVPGSGGGTGTEQDPFRGLSDAQAAAKPGTLFLLRAGTYPGPLRLSRSGEPGRPILWKGPASGPPAILDGGEPAPPRVVDATGAHDVWLEDLTIRRGEYGLVAHEAARLVVRRCRFTGVLNAIAATRNEKDALQDLFISDNVMEGPFEWPQPDGKRGASAPEQRAIQITGTGHVVCYNRISRFKDGIDTFPSSHCAAIDIHNNEIIDAVDDGIELDYSERNVRCWENRLTNVFQGISVQPIHGGPVYVFRNVLYNVEIEPFKLHNSPSGVLFYHNTVVKKGAPLLLWTSAPARNCVSRNNLFIGTDGRAAYDNDAPMVECDYDYDGFGGGPWPNFLKWNKQRYPTLAEVQAKAPVYRHAVQLDPAKLFAADLRAPESATRSYPPPDPRLSPNSGALDAGQPLPGFNDGYAGKAPDLGALELGQPLPKYGPRTR